MSDLDKAKVLYDDILKAIDELDDEIAHAREDKLREHALICFLASHPDAVEIGKLALSTSELEFARWCA